MNIRSKTALGALALALSCGPVLAQDDPPDPPAAQPAPPDSFGPPPPPMQMRGFDGGGGRVMVRVRRGFGPDERVGRDGFDGDGRGAGLTRLLGDPDIRQQVGVTDQQWATIRQQDSDFRKTEIRDRADIQVKRLDLRDLLTADKPDRAAIDAKLQEVSGAQLALSKAAVDHMLTMRDAITPAQRDKLRQLMRDRRQTGGRAGRGPGAQTTRRRGPGGGGGNAPARPGATPPQPPAQPTQ